MAFKSRLKCLFLKPIFCILFATFLHFARNTTKVNGLYENGTINMEFINQRMVKLPHTGSAKVLFMSVMGMFLMAKKLKEKE